MEKSERMQLFLGAETQDEEPTKGMSGSMTREMFNNNNNNGATTITRVRSFVARTTYSIFNHLPVTR
ncbi:hypothetical protein KM043_006142 [Ampulex compressa]|nr:hypothetical protein KM043_006142 [Ampulex compressa]